MDEKEPAKYEFTYSEFDDYWEDFEEEAEEAHATDKVKETHEVKERMEPIDKKYQEYRRATWEQRYQ